MQPKSEVERERQAKLQRLIEAGIDPYPARVKRTHTTVQAIAAFEAAEKDGAQVEVTVTGRLRGFRQMGKSSFGHIEDGAGRLQLYWRVNDVGEASYQVLVRDIDPGDFLEAQGFMFRTKTGEVSLHVKAWRVLSKSIKPLPLAKEQVVDGQLVRYSEFADTEQRYRERYADLAVHPEVREVFITRAKVVSALRRFLDGKGFLEVETPILQPVYGGAAARPFTTHHNQLHQDLYLRISFELYLKRLLVGGYERVYEIGRDFRNEGVSYKHNPEFTQLEFYAAYLDYNDVMSLTEEMIAFVAQEVKGSTQITYQGNTIELAPPWKRITMREAIRLYSEIDYVEHPDAADLRKEILAIGGHAPEGATWGKLVDGLLGDYVEPRLIQPTFITDYPRDISPLAKRKPQDLTHVERFEFFIGGLECGNAFSELNDTLDQEARFVEMAQLYKAEDEEAHPMDEDYLNAMSYGMPPCGGFGTGVDRLTMLFTDKDTIREVVLFPHLRSRE
jgi:lysyl-tRNA synthetase class 2